MLGEPRRFRCGARPAARARQADFDDLLDPAGAAPQHDDAVDLQTRNILQDELLRLWGDEGAAGTRRAVLLVTHGIDEAVYLSDRVIVLGRRPGQIKEIVDIELSGPRRAHRNSAALGRHVEHIWSLIRDEAARAIVEETA